MKYLYDIEVFCVTTCMLHSMTEGNLCIVGTFFGFVRFSKILPFWINNKINVILKLNITHMNKLCGYLMPILSVSFFPSIFSSQNMSVSLFFIFDSCLVCSSGHHLHCRVQPHRRAPGHRGQRGPCGHLSEGTRGTRRTHKQSEQIQNIFFLYIQQS